jgi:flagellar biogenesis protein FliO
MGTYGSYLVETFVTLVLVCGLAFLVLWSARRVGIGRPSGAIRLVGQLPIDARRAIYLVKVGAHVFVVGVAEGGMTKLGELAEGDVPAEPERPAPFADVLARAIGRGTKDVAPPVGNGTTARTTKEEPS